MLISHLATSDMFALAQGEAAGGLCRNRFWLTVFAHPSTPALTLPTHSPSSRKADAKDASTPWGANARKEIPFRIWASSILKMRKASMPERYSCLSRPHSDHGAQREFFLFDTEWVKMWLQFAPNLYRLTLVATFRPRDGSLSLLCDLFNVQASSNPVNLYTKGVLQWAKVQIIPCWYSFLN